VTTTPERKPPILFWSGGKDSFLAYDAIRGEAPDLLTSYDPATGLVPHQEIAIAHIRHQAAALGRRLIELPLAQPCPNQRYIAAVEAALRAPRELVFGDLHLADIRAWREASFPAHRCRFPLWQLPYAPLLARLWQLAAPVTVSGVRADLRACIATGARYDAAFVKALPPELDAMGERGEFHTRVDL
jgi:diphthamide synthase (EF-2-diphthine--ammonia ligase)